jgi:hypothetical protein
MSVLSSHAWQPAINQVLKRHSSYVMHSLFHIPAINQVLLNRRSSSWCIFPSHHAAEYVARSFQYLVSWKCFIQLKKLRRTRLQHHTFLISSSSLLVFCVEQLVVYLFSLACILHSSSQSCHVWLLECIYHRTWARYYGNFLFLFSL